MLRILRPTEPLLAILALITLSLMYGCAQHQESFKLEESICFDSHSFPLLDYKTGGSPIIDYMCASILAFGITSALLRREKTGKGGYVDVSLLMSSLVLQNNMISRLENLDAERYDTFLNWIDEARKDGVPFSEQVKKMPGVRDSLLQSVYYRTYETRDSAIAIACASVPLRKRLLAAINMKDEVLEGIIARDEVRNYYHLLSKKIEALFLSKDTSEWVSIFASEGIPAQPVKFPVEMLTDEQVEANSLVIHREHEAAGKIAFLNTPLSLDEDGFVAAPFPERFGSETEKILDWAGFSKEQIRIFLQDDAVGNSG